MPGILNFTEGFWGREAQKSFAHGVYPFFVNREEVEMSRFTRRALTIAALGAALVAMLAAGAVATRTIKVPTKISIKSNELEFSGKVTASPGNKPCTQQRKVVLFKVVSGGPDQAIGHDTTGNDSRWEITPQGSAGITLAHFYAKAKKRSDGAAGTIHICLAAKSKTIGVSH
jgi:hypothetical protein